MLRNRLPTTNWPAPASPGWRARTSFAATLITTVADYRPQRLASVHSVESSTLCTYRATCVATRRAPWPPASASRASARSARRRATGSLPRGQVDIRDGLTGAVEPAGELGGVAAGALHRARGRRRTRAPGRSRRRSSAPPPARRPGRRRRPRRLRGCRGASRRRAPTRRLPVVRKLRSSRLRATLTAAPAQAERTRAAGL